MTISAVAESVMAWPIWRRCEKFIERERPKLVASMAVRMSCQRVWAVCALTWQFIPFIYGLNISYGTHFLSRPALALAQSPIGQHADLLMTLAFWIGVLMTLVMNVAWPLYFDDGNVSTGDVLLVVLGGAIGHWLAGVALSAIVFVWMCVPSSLLLFTIWGVATIILIAVVAAWLVFMTYIAIISDPIADRAARREREAKANALVRESAARQAEAQRRRDAHMQRKPQKPKPPAAAPADVIFL